jgi:hypothetical protein
VKIQGKIKGPLPQLSFYAAIGLGKDSPLSVPDGLLDGLEGNNDHFSKVRMALDQVAAAFVHQPGNVGLGKELSQPG